MMMFFITIFSLVTLIPDTPQGLPHQGIKMFHPDPFGLKATHVEAITVDFNDTIPGNTLFINRSDENYPLSFCRKITTGVCIDNECRILRINLYWTMTGRYLGFELPEGEFLSKTEHVEFTVEEYKKLHQLLTDPYSILANFSMDELVPGKKVETDAVSSATISDVLAYSVEGAVYTTYTMWHLVYGDTRRKIIKLTEKELTAGLLKIILGSSNVEDRVWGLDHIQGYVKPTAEIYDLIFENINQDHMELARRAIEVIPTEATATTSVQLKFMDCFNSADEEIKRLILRKLMDAPSLQVQTIDKLTSGINQYHDLVITDILALLEEHAVNETSVLQKLTGLLWHENKFVARKAFQYLEKREIRDKEIKQQLELYKSLQK
jgi:hypothetical protein